MCMDSPVLLKPFIRHSIVKLTLEVKRVKWCVHVDQTLRRDWTEPAVTAELGVSSVITAAPPSASLRSTLLTMWHHSIARANWKDYSRDHAHCSRKSDTPTLPHSHSGRNHINILDQSGLTGSCGLQKNKDSFQRRAKENTSCRFITQNRNLHIKSREVKLAHL